MHGIIYTFHMPLFMFASGYIYIAFKRDESYGHFLWKKVKRLMIPYITTSIIVVTIKLLTQSFMYVENPVSLISYFRIFYLPEAGFYLWFIWALWWIFCLIPFFKTKKSRLLLLGISVVLHYISPFLNLPAVFCLRETAKMLIWFMLGVACFDWKVSICEVKGWHVLISLAVFAVMLIITSTGGISFYGTNRLLKRCGAFLGCCKYLIPYLGILFVMFFSKWISQHAVPKVLVVISSSSYIIYLFHTTFMGFTKAILSKVAFMKELPVLTIIIVVATGVICPILLHYFLNKASITRFLFGITK